MTRTRRKPPPKGNLRADQNWYRALDDAGEQRDDVSWHFLRTWNRDSTGIETLCGEQITMPQVSPDALPRGKTCESCLRRDQEGIVREREPNPPEPVQDQPPAPAPEPVKEAPST